MKMETVSVTAYIYSDRKEGLYTVTLKEKGGPVISATTEEEAREKFKKALNLSGSVQNLLNYYEAVKNAEKDGHKNPSKRSGPEVQFIQMQVCE